MAPRHDYKRIQQADTRDVELPELPASVNAHDAVSPVSSPAKPKGKVKVSPSPAKQNIMADEKSGPVKTVITIFISFVGAGVLGLPYAFLRSGYVMGTLCLLAVTGMSLHCMMLLLQCKRRLEDRGVTTYSEVASACLGPRFKKWTELLLVVSQTGFCVAYLIFIGTNMAPFTGMSKAVHVVIIVPFLISLAMLPSLTALAPISTAANLCNLLGMMVVLWDDVASFKTHEIVVPMTSLSNLPFMFGVSVYCFEGIGMILPMESAMKDRSKFPALLFGTVWLISGIFITFGLMGYIGYGPHTQDIVTLNLPAHWSSTMMILAVCTGLMFTFPVMMVPVYEILEKNLSAKDWFQKSVSPGNYALVFRALRSLLVCAVAFVAISVPAFGDFISLIGSLCCGILAFVVPAGSHLSLFGEELTRCAASQHIGNPFPCTNYLLSADQN